MADSRLIAGKKRAPESLGRVLVLGLGKSGRAAVEYCLALLGDRVESLAVAAGARNKASEEFAARALARGAQVAFGDDAVSVLAKSVRGGHFDLTIPSPGIPPFEQLYRDAQTASTELVSEVEFAWRESASDSRWIAVTGTNGKTTVASCTAHLLQSAGMAAAAVGNIGDTCLAAVVSGDVDVYVAEVSSYQLFSTVAFAPEVAVLLNITPDHVHWHETFENYRDAKLNILARLGEVSGGIAVLDATNEVVRAEVRRLHAMDKNARGFSYVPLGTAAGLCGDMRLACGSENAAFVDETGVLRVALGGQNFELLNQDELLIKGAHNASNMLAAATAALSLGADCAGVMRGMRSFAPLEHRIEPCGCIQGVCCYNDSKATNIDATLKALEAFPEKTPLVLLGGEDKGTDLAPLVQAVLSRARVAVCFGAAGERFVQAFEGALSSESNNPQHFEDFVLLRANHLEDALEGALEVARAEDVILLSPACASFDEFSSFEERGSVFKELVAKRVAQSEASV